MQRMSESFLEPNRFHVTNPFASKIEKLGRSNASAERTMSTQTPTMFSEIMSDYIPNSEQNAEMAAISQPNSSRASPDSATLADGVKNTTRSNAWPPLEVSNYTLDEWPNSNIRQTCRQNNTNEVITQASGIATPVAALLTPITCRDTLGPHAPASTEDRIPFLSGYTRSRASAKMPNKSVANQQTMTEGNLLRYIFRTSPMAGPSTGPDNAERLTYTPDSKASTDTAPDSTVTKAKKESQAIREDFRNSLGHLTQVQSRLTPENNEYVMRADAIMRDMDEKREGFLEIQAEGRQNKGRLEASMAFLNDLIK